MSNSYHTQQAAMLFWTTANQMTKPIANFTHPSIANPKLKRNLIYYKVFCNGINCSTLNYFLRFRKHNFMYATPYIHYCQW